MANAKRLYLSENKIIAGVCGGIAEYLEVDPTVVRIVWVILTALVIGLILYRKWVAKDEDDRLHTTVSEIGMVSRQAVVAQKLESIYRWGKALTVIALVHGFIVGVGYVYQSWVASDSLLR